MPIGRHVSGRQRRAAPGAGSGGAAGATGGGGAAGKRSRTASLPPAAGAAEPGRGASVHRLQATPAVGSFKPTEIGQTRHDEVTLTNVSDEPVDFFDYLETILDVGDGRARTSDDFDLGAPALDRPLEPGASVRVMATFTPRASHADDLKPGKQTRRAADFAVIDADGAVAGTVALRGKARAPSAETIDEGEVDELKRATRHAGQRRPPPQSYDDMRRHLMAAAELVQGSERAEAGELVDEVRARMDESLRYDQVLQAFRSYGLGTQSATTMVAHARDEVVGASRRLAAGWPVNMELVVTAFQVAKEPIQLVLHEIDRAPTIQAMHDAAPAVLAGKAAEELGATAKAIVTDAAFAAGFGLGVLEGAGGAVKDLATGVADALELAFDIAKALVTGGLIGAADRAADKLAELFDQAPAALAAMGDDFEKAWNKPDSFGRGNFRGEVIGYVAAQIAIIVISGGAAAEGVAFASLSRWGKVAAVIQKLDAAGDIVGWAGAAAARIKLPRKLMDRLRDARRGATVRVDAPHASGPPGTGSPETPHGTHDDPAPPARDGTEGESAGTARQGEDDAIIADRTREPYGDPRMDPTGPRRPLDRRELIPHRKLDVKKSWAEVERAHKAGDLSFAVGAKLKSADDGHEILARLSRGDATALEKLGIKDYPRDLDPTGREWALIQVRDGFAIYAGGYRKVELPPASRVLGHTHPGPDANLPDPDMGPRVDRRIRAEADGAPLAEVLADIENARNSGIVPSAADINAVSDGTAHVLYTRYVSVGDGKVANPLPGDARPRVQLHLQDAKVVRWHPRRKSYYYEVQVIARDATGKELWSGKMYAAWHAPMRAGDVYVKRPPALELAVTDGWREP